MSDGIRHVTHTIHQVLDAVQHPVDVDIKSAEFVITDHRDATTQVTGLDLPCGATDIPNTALQLVAKHYGAGRRENHGNRRSSGQRTQDEIPDRLLLARVAPNDQLPAIRQLAHDDSGTGWLAVALDLPGHELINGRRCIRRRAQVAPQALPGRRCHEKNLGIAVNPIGQLPLDFAQQICDRTGSVGLDQATGYRCDLPIDTSVHHADSAEVEHDRSNQDRSGQQQAIPQREPGRDRLLESNQRCSACNRPRVWCGSVAAQSPCRSCSAGG
jgi:hypothetical protein